MEPTVSVIIPAYNAEKYIDKCIRSVIEQSYKKVQIVVVNDGSSDSTREIIEKYLDGNEHIIFIDKQNEGVANARNDGIYAASGEYLLFVDSDDYIGTTYVEDMVNAAIINESELVISGYTLVTQDEKKIKEIVPDEYKSGEKEEWAYRICSTWGRLYSHTFWKKNKLFFLQEKGARAEDIPVAMYANAMAKNICVVQNSTYYYRQHDESAMHKGGGYFRFPYKAYKETFDKVAERRCENSIEFFLLGTIKLFAHFEFVIYRNASKEERSIFKKYICDLLSRNDKRAYTVWKKKRYRLRFPILHKVLMEFLMRKYKGCKEW